MAREPRMNFDLLIALAALVISTIAALASVYQSRIFATQLSATIWPYLSVGTTYPGDGSVSVSLANDGVGPALIRSARATFDGRPISSWNDLLSSFVQDSKRNHRSARFSATGIDQATIVRAGDRVTLLKLYVPHGDRLVTAERKRLRLSFCYCSIQNTCWTIDSELQGQPPADTASCPKNEAISAAPVVVRP
jgi:hypothetical protein